MSFFGIDVSSENGIIDWTEVKRSGVEFAILRCHQRYGTEAKFAINYKKAKKAGMPQEAYWPMEQIATRTPVMPFL